LRRDKVKIFQSKFPRSSAAERTKARHEAFSFYKQSMELWGHAGEYYARVATVAHKEAMAEKALHAFQEAATSAEAAARMMDHEAESRQLLIDQIDHEEAAAAAAAAEEQTDEG
jgi:hypothetical protein